jgi:3-deoxy-D-manno-octulosonate 8-phosphate phosphatase (KDO 8-P phosphatase)
MVHLPNVIKEKARAIRLVVFDVDGVLTDGTLSYSASGEEVKHFNVKDGVGIKLLNVCDMAFRSCSIDKLLVVPLGADIT